MSGPIATKILRGRSDKRPRLRMYRLRIETPARPEQRIEVDQPVLRVGVREENDLVLADDAVSRIHFEITCDENGHRLRDLGSTNGTFVDGFRVADVYLKPACTITAGVTSIHFELLDAEAELAISAAEQFGPLVGRSAAMRNLFATLERVAPTDTTVLIQGESGTGKELIAEAIHGASARAQQPFVVFDCGAIAGALLESELFGHEKGAFTGALSDRAGCLEEADGGTLFLDEIGELPIELQPKLLRAVERRELKRVGSNKTKQVDVRIIAATNRDLSAEVNRGSFRADLFYRLAVVRLEVPPLRTRPDDIPLLVEHLLGHMLGGDAAKVAAVLASITEDSWRKLGELAWHGNVRELRNFVERRLALGAEPAIITEPGAPAASSGSGPHVDAVVDLSRPFIEQRDALIAKFERAYLHGVLEQEGRNISRAAAIARIDRMYFKRLLKKHS